MWIRVKDYAGEWVIINTDRAEWIDEKVRRVQYNEGAVDLSEESFGKVKRYLNIV